MYAAKVLPGTRAADCPAASRFRRDVPSKNRSPAKSIGKRAASFPCSTNEAASPPIPIIAVDGDPVFLESLRAMLQPHTEAVRLAASFTSVAEALAQIEFIVPDLALIDSLTDADLIRKQSPSTALLLVPSVFDPLKQTSLVPWDGERARRGQPDPGNYSVLKKPFRFPEFLEAITLTLRRFSFLREKHLTDREVQVLDLVTDESLLNKEIADRLDCKVPVVEKILRKIYRKLGVVRRPGAIIPNSEHETHRIFQSGGVVFIPFALGRFSEMIRRQ